MSREEFERITQTGGATLKKGKPVELKTGWHVGLEGVVTDSIEEAVATIETFKGNCGIWIEQGRYYIDKVVRVRTKKAAFQLGREHNQLSVFQWSTKRVVYL